jgi:hypothetical protein
MKKADVVSVVNWADSYVSESQNSVMVGYKVSLPFKWDCPDGARMEMEIKDPKDGAPPPRVQRLLCVAFGACHRLYKSDQIQALRFFSLVQAKILSEKISTKAELVKIIFKLVPTVADLTKIIVKLAKE